MRNSHRFQYVFAAVIVGAGVSACAFDQGDDSSSAAAELRSRRCGKHTQCTQPPPSDEEEDGKGEGAGDGGSALPPTPPTTPTTCSSFIYSAWSACQPDGTQTRTVTSSSPSGCTGGSPVLSQSCTYTPPTTSPSTCTSFIYSAWSACQPNNTQTRTVTSSSPSGCTGGSPTLSQACTYIDGRSLYNQYCSGCHGTGKLGSSASKIQSAINGNVGGMGSLSALTPEQVAAIAAAR